MIKLARTVTLGWIVLVCAGALGVAVAQETVEQPPIVAEAQALMDDIKADLDALDALRKESEAATGDDLLLLEHRRFDLGVEALGKLDNLVDNVLKQDEEGLDATTFRTFAEELIVSLGPIARERVSSIQAEIKELSEKRETATGNELIEIEDRIDTETELIGTVLELTLDNIDNLEALGLPAEKEREVVGAIVGERAATAAARIELTLERISALQNRLKETPDDAELQTELTAFEARRDRATASLSTAIDLMDRLGLETAEYRELLIQSTGQITTDILDTDVALGLFGRWMNSIGDWFVESGPRVFFKILVFVFIMFIFRLLSRLTRKVVAKAVATSKLKFSQLLQKTFVSVSGNVVMIIGLLVALSQLGFSLGPILAGLGIAGFIIGFALQEVLGNFAAGVMILVYRPFDVGDMIEAAGVFGKVSAMSMVSTTILTIDNQTLVVPNGKIWGDVIKNVTAQRVRRVDMVFGISYSDDIPHTEKVLADIVREHPKVLDDPEPIIRLHTLGESSVDFVVRPWVQTDDYWDVYWEITREVKMRFDREGISIPFPQRDVHFYEQKRITAGDPRAGGPQG
jgi:small conductance mechanosensitive channel